MTEIPKLEDDMGFDHMSCCSNGEKISVTKSDSFVVDMERFSHLMEKDINSSSTIFTRNLSRKESVRNGEMKITGGNGRDTNNSMLTTSPRASLNGSSMPEKPTVVATDHSHHQITITNSSMIHAVATKSKYVVAKRFSFRRTPPTWTSDPRRILVFFATLSSMGTILLIYFTLSMGKFNGDYNASI